MAQELVVGVQRVKKMLWERKLHRSATKMKFAGFTQNKYRGLTQYLQQRLHAEPFSTDLLRRLLLKWANGEDFFCRLNPTQVKNELRYRVAEGALATLPPEAADDFVVPEPVVVDLTALSDTECECITLDSDSE
jgi:hypothetical protein